jgi:hypothetical protein
MANLAKWLMNEIQTHPPCLEIRIEVVGIIQVNM